MCGCGFGKPDAYTVVPTLAEVRDKFPQLNEALDNPEVKGERL